LFIHRPPTVIASLPWYDLKEVRGATDALWRELARQFRRLGLPDVPQRLTRSIPYERQWRSAGFLFGQACGYDARIAYRRELQVVATPQYDAAGCEGNSYSSFVVARRDAPFRSVEDLRGTRCAINSPTSHSGMNVLRALVAPLQRNGRFFADVLVSGSHEASLLRIQRGQADVAAIDCVTYALLARHRPQALVGIRVLHRTQCVPAPPYVTAASTPWETLARMREAIDETFHRPAMRLAREVLLLRGVEVLPTEAYDPIERLRAVARDHGYSEIPGDFILAA
jgi:ABC-type phosphate/phosphonate transport system substrate-binding protein